MKRQQRHSRTHFKTKDRGAESIGARRSSGPRRSEGLSRRKTGAGFNSLSGIIKRHPDGFGFLVPDDSHHPDVYISREAMATAMSGDHVKAEVFPDSPGRFRGRIQEIIKRGFNQVSGRMQRLGTDRGILKDESLAWGRDLVVTFSPGLAPKSGDWVLAKIESYPDSHFGFTGRVVAVLGDPSVALNDNLRILAKHEIPYEFSEEAKREAKNYPSQVTHQDREGREDLRSKTLITIDGVTAKDFDDAVLVESTSKGYRLIVAIADVSHYVKPGSVIDREAFLKGTSTYFPNFVSPMLPEVLSNELCSLKPNVERLALVADLQMDHSGELLSSRFYEAVIRSHARVTYGQAQEVLDGLNVHELESVAESIRIAGGLANVLMKKRFREGSLDLEIPETQVEVDGAGEPVDIMRSKRLFAHRLIEELMLSANVAVAKFLSAKKIPSLYRVHDKPDPDKLGVLENFLHLLGFQKKLDGRQKLITEALVKFSGKPEETVLNILALRSMKQAEYSVDNIGHYGLNFSFYTHFTSPIRRYPDLIVHRLLKSQIRSGYASFDEADLRVAASLLSGCEQRSVKAERHLKSIKKARFLKRYLGQEFDGVISSVAKFGVFVLLRQYDIDGLLRAEELGHEEFQFDEELVRLVGRDSGQVYKIGDELKVQVAAVDIEEGRIDFVLTGARRVRKKEPTQKGRSHKKNFARSRSARFSRSRKPRSHR